MNILDIQRGDIGFMNKKYKGITILVALFLLMLCSYYSVKKAYFIKNQKNDKKIILIDPGHGGMDGGAVSKNGTVEKDINLSISLDRKSTRLNSSHANISYAVFCLKKKQ